MKYIISLLILILLLFINFNFENLTTNNSCNFIPFGNTIENCRISCESTTLKKPWDSGKDSDGNFACTEEKCREICTSCKKSESCLWEKKDKSTNDSGIILSNDIFKSIENLDIDTYKNNIMITYRNPPVGINIDGFMIHYMKKYGNNKKVNVIFLDKNNSNTTKKNIGGEPSNNNYFIITYDLDQLNLDYDTYIFYAYIVYDEGISEISNKVEFDYKNKNSII